MQLAADAAAKEGHGIVHAQPAGCQLFGVHSGKTGPAPGRNRAGASILENIPEFTHIIDIIYSHHEKWDGTGYPKRLKGVNIPLGARIIAVANYYDRIVNPCTHYWQKTPLEAIKEMKDKSGTDFDPNVVRAFLESIIPCKIK